MTPGIVSWDIKMIVLTSQGETSVISHLPALQIILSILFTKAPFTPESYASVTPETSEHFWCESANPAQILPPSRSS